MFSPWRRSANRRTFLASLLGTALTAACAATATPSTTNPPIASSTTSPGPTGPAASPSTASPPSATLGNPPLTAAPSATYSAAHVQQAVKLEQIRGHLVAALTNTQAGRTDLARTHTEHPLKEEYPAIAGAVKEKDAALAQKTSEALTNDLTLLDQKSDAKQFESAVAQTNQVLDEVQRLLLPSPVAGHLAFQGNVLAALLDVVAEEYGEGVEGGTVTNEVEYQDAYTFFQRGRALWRGFEDQVKAKAPTEYEEIEEQLGHLKTALKEFATPTQPVPAEQVEGWTKTAGHGLAEATGFTEANATTPAGSPADDLTEISRHLDPAMDALKAGDVATAKQEYQAFDDGWEHIEDGIRAKSRDQYRKIEEAMGEVTETLLKPDQPNTATALAALTQLDETVDAALPNLR